MRRSSWFLLIAGALVCTPFLAHAQSTLQPIINLSGGSCTCPGSAPDWGCVLQIAQTAMNDIVAFASIIITIYIAWAGIAFMTSSTSAEGRTKARNRVVNAVLGLVIVLAAWLLIDSLMKVIYNSGASAIGVAALGPWNSILSDADPSDQCIKTVTTIPTLPGLTAGSNALGGPQQTQSPTVPAVTGPAAIAGDCSAANLTQTWGSAALGNTFACIINDESKCQNILNVPTATDHSSAGGRYQILITDGYKGQPPFVSQEPACVAIDKGINCDLYFHGGYSDGSANAKICDQALLDPTCNTQMAQALYKASGNKFNTENWLGVGDIGGKNQACVTQYDH